MKFLYVFIMAAAMQAVSPILSSAQCTSCTQTITTSSGNYNVNSNDVLCIAANVNFTGNINLNGGTLCNAGTITNGSLNFNSGIINNYGTITRGGLSFGGTLNNYGNLNIGGDLNLNTNSILRSYGTLTVSNSLNNNSQLYNEGSISVSGSYNANSNSVNSNSGTLSVAQTVSLNAPFSNNGSWTVGGNFTVNSNGSLNNGQGNTLSVGGSYTNNSTTLNNGIITVNGNFVNNSNGTFTNNNSMTVEGNFTNNGPINGDNTGCNSFVVKGIDIVQNSSGSITSNDFCGSNVPGNFSRNNGNVNSNVTFCSCTNSGGGVTPLPIVLKSFDATCNGESVTIDWATYTEINNAFFTVYRSEDAINWESIHVTEGAGNSNQEVYYSFQDYRPLSGTAYYRLQQTDLDGTTEYFDPTSISCATNENAASISVFPNPADELWNVTIKSAHTDARALMEIVDFTGRKVAVKKLSILSGEQTFTYERNGIAAGTYLIRVIAKGEVLDTQKIILR